MIDTKWFSKGGEMTKTAEVIEIKPHQIIDYNVPDAAIEAIRQEYSGLEITNVKSYRVVVTAIGEVRAIRVAVENKRKEMKKDALAYGRAVDAEAKRIKGMLEPLEEELKATKQAEDGRKAAIKAEAERKEQERIDGIRQQIECIRRMCAGLPGLNSKQLQNLALEIEMIRINPNEYDEFASEANVAKSDTWTATMQALEIRERLDREDAERKAEVQRLEKIRQEQEAEGARLNAEREAQERVLAAERKKEEERLSAIRGKEDAKRQAAQDKIDAERRKIEKEKAKFEADKRAEQERKDREEFERQVKVKADQGAKENAEREAAEAKAKAGAEEAERERQEALRPDIEKLDSWAEYISHIPDPGLVSDDAINLYRTALAKIAQVLFEMLEEAEAL